jgi:hypothetical protein
MKLLSLILILTLSFSSQAESLEGTVTFSKKQSKGVLFIFAKKFDDSVRMPLAVKRIENPKFPYKFKLSQSDAMIKSIPFSGPFKVIARLSPSGDVMDKSGPEGVAKGPLTKGTKNIKISLTKK